MTTLESKLIDTNKQLNDQDRMLLESINLMGDANSKLIQGNNKLKEQSDNMKQIDNTNKNIYSKYKVTNKTLDKVRSNVFCKKFMIVIIIFLLFIADVAILVFKLVKK